MSRDESLLVDILLAARQIVRYTEGISRNAFLRDEMLQDAVQRQIQIVGEAAFQVSSRTKDAHPEVQWHEMIGMRHRLVHDYAKIDLRRVYETATKSVPSLISVLERIVPHEEAGGT